MITDSGWQYFDVQMCITKRLQTFFPDIKLLTLAPPTAPAPAPHSPPPPAKPLKFFSVLCIFRSSTQAHSIELFQCYR